MRKTLIATLVLVLCVVAGFAFAQTGTGTAATGTGTSTGTGGTETTGTHPTGGKHKGYGLHSYKGYVSGVDQTAKSFNLSSCPTCQDIFVIWPNEKTKYSPKGKSWDDVTVGAHVSGKYKTADDKNWALTVHFWKGKHAAAKTGAR
jgi:hypothetical protein